MSVRCMVDIGEVPREVAEALARHKHVHAILSTAAEGGEEFLVHVRHGRGLVFRAALEANRLRRLGLLPVHIDRVVATEPCDCGRVYELELALRGVLEEAAAYRRLAAETVQRLEVQLAQVSGVESGRLERQEMSAQERDLWLECSDRAFSMDRWWESPVTPSEYADQCVLERRRTAALDVEGEGI